jgi:hypothetical protein
MKYSELVSRKRREFGDKFDDSDLDPTFRPYFESGDRIRVVTKYGNAPDAEVWERTGCVSVTTGPRPAFLLMARRDCSGSSDLLLPGRGHRVTAVKRGRMYRPV